MVVGVRHQAEGAMMGGENVADEQKAEALALRLGGEERREQMRCHGRGYAPPVVGDGELCGRGRDDDEPLLLPHALHSVFDDVD